MRRNHWLLFLLATVLAGLTGLTACGGGGNGTGGNGGGGGGTNPTPSGVTIYPGANGSTVSVAAGSTVQFTAYQADALVSVNWTASSGTITGNGTSSGTFTAPTAQGSVTVSAVSTSSSTTGGSVTVNVTAPSASGILVNPGATVVAAGGTMTFSATLNGGAVSPAPTWQVNGANGGDGVHGTIDANGNYHGASYAAAGRFHDDHGSQRRKFRNRIGHRRVFEPFIQRSLRLFLHRERQERVPHCRRQFRCRRKHRFDHKR